jgi:hypothetical protein
MESKSSRSILFFYCEKESDFDRCVELLEIPKTVDRPNIYPCVINYTWVYMYEKWVLLYNLLTPENMPTLFHKRNKKRV